MMNKNEKIHEAAFRIIEILKMLLNGDISKKDIMHNNDILNTYTNEAYLKYFNTFHELGFDIVKTKDTYSLKNSLIYIELNKDEEKVFSKIIQSIPSLNSKNKEEIISLFFKKLDKYLTIDLNNEIKNTAKYKVIEENNTLYTIKQALDNKLTVRLTYKNMDEQIETIDVEPRKIVEENNDYYLICQNSSMERNRKININSINSVVINPNQSKFFDTKSTVIFEVYGRLVKSYRLRAWEILDDFSDDYLRIINTKEDFESLLPRLLKYGENCKIIKPQNVVNKFLNITNNILKNLEPCHV